MADRVTAWTAPADGDVDEGAIQETVAERVERVMPAERVEPAEPVMPSPPFPRFTSRPTLPHQSPGVGFESGRDSRAR